ncbi:colicin E5-related ribonuclease [Clostridium saccharoperbutylacetonicum]|jgi:uncharacterized protein (DUF2252 family)
MSIPWGGVGTLLKIGLIKAGEKIIVKQAEKEIDKEIVNKLDKETVDQLGKYTTKEAIEAEKAGSSIKFGSGTKSTKKISNQMTQMRWTESTVRDIVSNTYTTCESINKATGNSATVYYNEARGYVIIDDITKSVVQVSDNVNPSA